MKTTSLRVGLNILDSSLLLLLAVLLAAPGPVPVIAQVVPQKAPKEKQEKVREDKPEKMPQEAPGKFRATTGKVLTPETEDIPPHGAGRNFHLVGHNPLLDSDQGTSNFDRYINPPFGIPRGSNGDITAAGDCVYVGSFIGYLPVVIVDVSNPHKPTVVGAVPDLPPGVGNGIEGIEASGDLLVIDQRESLGGLGFPVPPGMPARGLAIYDISNCRHPRLVARYDFRGKDTHTVSLWRDPQDPRRVLAIESFIDEPDLQVLDLTGCPQACNPRLVASWSVEAQFGPLRDPTGFFSRIHEAIMSTDGNRIYMAQLRDGFFMLDSSPLMRTLRGLDSCDPTPPPSPGAEGHCLTALNANYDAREDTAPPFSSEWHHTPIKVPDRPYVLELQESSGPVYVPNDPLATRGIRSMCPGSFARMVYVGEDDFQFLSGPTVDGSPMRGDLFPKTVGVYATPEQRPENCGPMGFRPGTAPLTSSWFSPHDGLVFPSVAILTYYGAGIRAIDISDPFMLREAGHFFNKPVETVRWASYGILGEIVPGGPDGLARRRPTVGPPHMFAFSYVLSHNGNIIYADVHSGLYILRYTGPHKEEILEEGLCLSGNPGAIVPGREPCGDYGKTDWNGSRQALPGGGHP